MKTLHTTGGFSSFGISMHTSWWCCCCIGWMVSSDDLGISGLLHNGVTNVGTGLLKIMKINKISYNNSRYSLVKLLFNTLLNNW